MTGERLKGHVLIGRTVPRGAYSSFKLEWELEFWVDESTLEDKTEDLLQRMKAELERRGIVNA